MEYLDLRSLQVFVSVCEKGNMTEAARSLGITQSAVSQSIKELERYIGVRLVDRSLRPLRPTPAGSVLYQRGRSLLIDARETQVLTWQYGSGTLPKLRVGLNFNLSRGFTTRLVRVLRHQRRPPELIIWNSGDADHIPAFLNRDLDMIVSADAIEHIEGLERHDIVKEAFVMVVPKPHGHPAEALDLDAVVQHYPLIRYSARTRVGQHIERHLRRIRLNATHEIELESPESLLEMVGEGIGWSVVTPLNILYGRIETRKVSIRSLPGPGFNRRLTLVAREGEFGEIPAKLANISRDIIGRYLIPEIESIDAGLASFISVIGTTEGGALP